MSLIRCHKCEERASIRMRQHRLNLCKDHFIEWFIAQTERSIQHYKMFGKKDRVLVAVSGGKDSLALWDVLWRSGYQTDGFYIDLGIDEKTGYSTTSREKAVAFALERNLCLTVVDVQADYGESIPEIARRTRRGQEKPCSTCGLVKRHIMNDLAVKGGYDAIATGHNLDDEAAVLFSNTFNWEKELLLRQAPLLQEREGFAKKCKPLYRFYERETAAYALLQGIDYIEDECPFALGSTSISYKLILNQMEETSPGAKIRFFSKFLSTRESGFFNASAHEYAIADLKACTRCGHPTSWDGLCAFCKLFSRGE